MKKNTIKVVGGVLAIAIVATLGYVYYKSKQKTPTTSSGYIAMRASKMNLAVNVQGTGTIVGDSKNVSSSSNGTLQEFTLKVGDSVKMGEKIGSINADTLKNSAAKAQNNVNKQKIQLDNLNNSLKSAQTQLSNAQNDLKAAQGQLATAAPIDVKTLNDKITSLQNQITTQTNNILNYQNQIATQNINISDAQNDLNTATVQLSQGTITSPVDGVVTAVNNANGDSVQQGKAIVTIINPASFKVKVSIDELDIAKIKNGEVAQVTFGALKDKKFTGKVEDVSLVGTTTNNVTTYDVTIALDSLEGVQLGMTATVNIEVANKENVVVIPVEALIEKNGKKYVMEPTDGGQTGGTKNKGQQSNTSQSSNKGNQTGGTNTPNRGNQASGGNYQAGSQKSGGQTTYSGGKLVEIQTGLQNENYIEVVSGITEGQSVLVTLPKSTSGTTTKQQGAGGLGGGNFGGGGFGGGSSGGQRQGGSSGGK